MRARDPSRDVQAQAHAADGTLQAREFLEQSRAALRRDPGTVVGDADPEEVRGGVERYQHLFLPAAELRGVRQQVGEDLSDAHGVELHRQALRCVDENDVGREHRPHVLRRLRDHLACLRIEDIDPTNPSDHDLVHAEVTRYPARS